MPHLEGDQAHFRKEIDSNTETTAEHTEIYGLFITSQRTYTKASKIYFRKTSDKFKMLISLIFFVTDKALLKFHQ